MKQIFVFYILMLLYFTGIFSCNPIVKKVPEKTLSDSQLVEVNINSIKLNSQPGDLIVRLSDDMISEIIKQMAEGDKSFSHAGIVVIKHGKKFVCHILPDDNKLGADSVRFEPIDSFINPKTNLSCGWFRYDLTLAEINNLTRQLDSFYQRNVHFDRRFDLKSDDELYCSEMIMKAMQKATNKKLQFSQMYVPERMIKMLVFYFKKIKLTYAEIKKRPYISIESLYNMPQCKEIMRTKLKIMP
ncbi:MAG: hypothetical protein IPJ81_05380 [Chitinophagaceae bacterium]|nr:hypothetical protein [Chitinophagaceae bacterium]